MSSKALVITARRRVTRLLNALTGLLRFAATARRRVRTQRSGDLLLILIQTGHKALECTERRAIDTSNIATKSADAAWDDLMEADKGKDLDAVKEVRVHRWSEKICAQWIVQAIKVYHKAEPSVDYVMLENAFRQAKCKTYLIASVSVMQLQWMGLLMLDPGEGGY